MNLQENYKKCKICYNHGTRCKFSTLGGENMVYSKIQWQINDENTKNKIIKGLFFSEIEPYDFNVENEPEEIRVKITFNEEKSYLVNRIHAEEDNTIIYTSRPSQISFKMQTRDALYPLIFED